jgi:hypothetical protein
MPLGDNTANTYENYEGLALSCQRDGPTRHKAQNANCNHYELRITYHASRFTDHVSRFMRFNRALEG